MFFLRHLKLFYFRSKAIFKSMKTTTVYLIIGITIGLFLGYNKLMASRQRFDTKPDRPFPNLWRQILAERVEFYNRLSRTDKNEFERKVHIFLLNVRIRGMNTEVTHVDKILIAAGAVIPIFRFSKWHYANLEEVQLYPDKFLIPNSTKMANGLVGWGAMEGKMMLSRKAVHHGFYDNTDNKNVAIHEFIHILDKQDGKIDGVMGKVMNELDIMPWLQIINIKMNEIDFGESSIREYGKTNQAEFLAVVSEYFFENPEKLQLEHPGLYYALDGFYNEKTIPQPVKNRFMKRRFNR
jgi:Mlc titration factor MtfA (ptsG expression regulator)